MNEDPPMSKRSRWLAIVAFALAAFCPVCAQGQSVEDVVAKVEPAIVCVLVSRNSAYRDLGLVRGDEPPGKLGGFDFDNDLRLPKARTAQDEELRRAKRNKLELASPGHVPESFGSGIVVDRKGLILTNYHVVQDATKVFVRLPGGKGSYADIWAADPRSDLAVLKLLDERLSPKAVLPMGNADGLRRGQAVIALANPFAAGLHDGQPSVSTGIISNLRRRVPGRVPVRETSANPLYQFGVLIQTDARIALGSSGGALLNTKGECIGITTSLAAVAGLDAPGGFAMPINSTMRKVIDILKRGEEVDYGFLGIAVEDAAPQAGAKVSLAQTGSPAFNADLRTNDIIVAIGPHPVRDSQDLMLGLGLYLAGETAPIVFHRNGQKQTANVALVKYAVLGKTISSSLGNRPYVGGLRVDYTSLLVQKPNFRADIPEGVLVTDVQPDSRAFLANILKEDIITHVGAVAVTTPAAFYEQVSRQAGRFELTILRGNLQQKTRW
jgi:serine protease Do